jgi:integrase
VAPAEEPTFHVLASEWVAARAHEVEPRTVEHWKWALSGHLLPAFAAQRPSEITIAAVESYKTTKLLERQRADERKAVDPRARISPALSKRSINSTLQVLASLLDHAIDLGYIETNVARGRKRRLKAPKPRRTWLEVEELNALLDAAGPHKPLIATMALAGLRVREACALRFRDLDLASGRLRVTDAKTDAGIRQVDLTPMLLDELKVAKASANAGGPDDLVFPTKTGTMRDRNNVRARVLEPTLRRANAKLAAAGRPQLVGITNHTLRRTFCALLYEAGASPAYAMSQMGHTSAALALEVYSKVMDRKRDTGVRMDALLQAADWARMGTSDADAFDSVSVVGAAMTPEVRV